MKNQYIKFTVIKTISQYNDYCDLLEEMLTNDAKKYQDEIELLTLLVETWDREKNTFEDLQPIELLKGLLEENGLKAKDLIEILGLSKGTISKIMNYQSGISKEAIRKLSDYFKISQEAFNRPYKLNQNTKRRFKKKSLQD